MTPVEAVKQLKKAIEQEKQETTRGDDRIVVTELEILANACITCNAPIAVGCRSKQRRTLAFVPNSPRLAFHRERVYTAIDKQWKMKLNDQLNLIDRWMIVYYAFVLACSAISSKSKELFGTERPPIEIESFFCAKAAEEMGKDHLFD